MYTQKKGDQ